MPVLILLAALLLPSRAMADGKTAARPDAQAPEAAPQARAQAQVQARIIAGARIQIRGSGQASSIGMGQAPHQPLARINPRRDGGRTADFE